MESYRNGYETCPPVNAWHTALCSSPDQLMSLVTQLTTADLHTSQRIPTGKAHVAAPQPPHLVVEVVAEQHEHLGGADSNVRVHQVAPHLGERGREVSNGNNNIGVMAILGTEGRMGIAGYRTTSRTILAASKMHPRPCAEVQGWVRDAAPSTHWTSSHTFSVCDPPPAQPTCHPTASKQLPPSWPPPPTCTSSRSLNMAQSSLASGEGRPASISVYLSSRCAREHVQERGGT